MFRILFFLNGPGSLFASGNGSYPFVTNSWKKFANAFQGVDVNSLNQDTAWVAIAFIMFFMPNLAIFLVPRNVKNKRTNDPISFRKETKTFWYRPRIFLIDNRLLLFGPESALLDQIEMISFDKTNSGTNSNVLVSFRLDIGKFVERLFLYCFDITRVPFFIIIITDFSDLALKNNRNRKRSRKNSNGIRHFEKFL